MKRLHHVVVVPHFDDVDDESGEVTASGPATNGNGQVILNVPAAAWNRGEAQEAVAKLLTQMLEQPDQEKPSG